MGKIKITLNKSIIGRNQNQRNIVKALGLKKTNSSVIKEDSPQIRGMIEAIDFMLSVEEME